MTQRSDTGESQTTIPRSSQVLYNRATVLPKMDVSSTVSQQTMNKRLMNQYCPWTKMMMW